VTKRYQLKTAKKNQIIEAASAVFAQKGFARTTIAEVATQAGIGKGTVYEYFKSKEDLYFAVFEWFMAQTGSAVMVSIATLKGTAAEKLKAVSTSLMNSWDEMQDIFALFMEFWSASASPQNQPRFKQVFKNGYGEFRGIVAALITEGIEHQEFRADIQVAPVAAALVGTWDALLLQAWFDTDFDHKQAAAEFMDVLIQGLKP
jgi:AcrR family transcriptional regulator